MPSDRLGFADLCNELGIISAVEIGTHRADFAARFLDRFNGTLYCVDPYVNYPGDPKLWPEQQGTRNRADDLAEAVRRLSRFGKRAVLVRASSLDAAAKYGEAWRPGFVHIDGCHEEASVAADIAAWWPLLVPGGIMSGHDWRTDDAAHLWPGVRRAVDAFFGPGAVQVTSEMPSSWWLRKGGPSSPA